MSVCFHRFSLRVLPCAALFWSLSPFPALAAAPFPEITEAERLLEVLADYPHAPAVVLHRNGYLKLMEPGYDQSSSLEVRMRIKVLTEEGKDHGEVSIRHSRFTRLDLFEARTVRADGSIVEMPAEAVFKEESSRAEKIFLTKAVFPAVEVGAILDLRYILRWDTLYFLEPWVFESDLPTLHSEINYEIPAVFGFERWWQQKSAREIHQELEQKGVRHHLRVWMDDLPPIPDEPYSFPRDALASRFMIIPRVLMVRGQEVPLLKDWDEVAKNFEPDYDRFRKKSKASRQRATALTSGAADPRQKVAALHTFVRDQVRTLSGTQIWVDEKRTADQVLAESAGTRIEKVLFLQAMLEACDLEPLLVWGTSRRIDQPDLRVPNPWWVDRPLAAVEIDGELLYLDPNDPALAPGRLQPSFEAMPALLVDRREVVRLPASPFEDHQRRAHLRLTLDEEGRVSGHGTLTFAGHPAWEHLRREDTPEGTTEAWSVWLEERIDGFEIAEVTVEEDVDAGLIKVAWVQNQREEDVLGDEATLTPSQPIGPILQHFQLPAERRMTPVLLPYAASEELVLELDWPDAWELEAAPEEVAFANDVGSFTTRVEHDAGHRTLRYERRFALRQAVFDKGDPYRGARGLYDTVEKHDAQELVLVLP